MTRRLAVPVLGLALALAPAFAAPPGAVSDLAFVGHDTLTWDMKTHATTYNLYRGDMFQVPADQGTAIQRGLTTNTTTEPTLPVAGGGFFYLVSGSNVAGEEGPTGLAKPAGLCSVVLDGQITPTEWPSDWSGTNTVQSDWGTANSLRAVRACYDLQNLYVLVDGQVNGSNALFGLLDAFYGRSVSRAVATTPDGLGDYSDALNSAVSSHPYGASWPAPFVASFAFGSVGMSSSASNAGWRDLADASHFALPAGSSVACGRKACEFAIPWTSLYGPDGRPRGTQLALFARLGAGSVWSNQTLPQDDPLAPAHVTQLLAFTPAP